MLRGFSAPVRLEYSPPLSDEDLAFLMAYDTDPFNKWEQYPQPSLQQHSHSTHAYLPMHTPCCAHTRSPVRKVIAKRMPVDEKTEHVGDQPPTPVSHHMIWP